MVHSQNGNVEWIRGLYINVDKSQIHKVELKSNLLKDVHIIYIKFFKEWKCTIDCLLLHSYEMIIQKHNIKTTKKKSLSVVSSGVEMKRLENGTGI